MSKAKKNQNYNKSGINNEKTINVNASETNTTEKRTQIEIGIIIAIASLIVTSIGVIVSIYASGLFDNHKPPVVTAAPPGPVLYCNHHTCLNIMNSSGVATTETSSPAVTDVPAPETTATAVPPSPPEFYVYKDLSAPENLFQKTTNIGSENSIFGNDGSISIDVGYEGTFYSNSTCIKITYTPPAERTKRQHWSGMYWSPEEPTEDDNAEDTFDISKVSKLKFYAKGNGKVEFFIESDKIENGKREKEKIIVELTDEWTEYTLEIPDDWETIYAAFGWSSSYIKTDGKSITFFVDEIAFYE